HVSPLMGMERRYDWRLTVPSQQLMVHIESHPQGEEEGAFHAPLSLGRREIDARSLRRALVRYPLLTLRVQAHIYGHALRLRARGARWHPHPKARARTA